MASDSFRRILLGTGVFPLTGAILLCVTVFLTSATAKDRRDQEQSREHNQLGSLQWQVAQTEQRNFSIPVQPLASALTTFGQQSGLQVTFDAAIAKDKQSHPVVGIFTPQEALNRILTSTDISYRFLDGHTVVLERTLVQSGDARIQIAPTTVKGQAVKVEETRVVAPREESDKTYVATQALSATKSNVPIIETPQSISVVTRAQLDAQNVQRIPEALAYTAGVAIGNGADDRFDSISARGFNLDQYLDGLKLLGGTNYVVPQLDPYFFERIEVLKGPASVLYGQASPGGLINLVSKRPTTEPFYEIRLQTGNRERMQGAFDIGGPLDKEGHLLYRLTGLARHVDTQVDHTEEERLSIAPALTWQPTLDTTLTILSNFQYDPAGGFYNQLPAQGTVLSNPNGKLPSSRYLGEPDFDKYQRTQYLAGYLLEQKFSDKWSVRQNFRYNHVGNDFNSLFPLFLEEDLRTAFRDAFINREYIDVITLDNQVQGEIITGPIRHAVMGGVDYQRRWKNQRAAEDIGPSIDIFEPIYHQEVPAPPPVLTLHQTQDQLGAYFQDHAKMGRWVLLFGGRRDWAETDTKSNGEKRKQSDHATTWRSGIVYLFDMGLAPYFSYAQSFQPTSGSDFNGNAFKPTTGEQFELGLKYQLLELPSLVTLSFYHLTQQNVLTADPEHRFFAVQRGEVRSRGIELEGRGSPIAGLDLITTYAYVDNKVTESTDIDKGKALTGVPKHLMSFWGDYTLQQSSFAGLGFGAGVRYVSSTFGDFANTFKVPDYTLVDFTVHYDLLNLGILPLNGMRLAVNLNNALDEKYVIGCGSFDTCSFGLRREILASVNYRW